MAKIKNINLSERHLITLKEIVSNLRQKEARRLAELFFQTDIEDDERVKERIKNELDKDIELSKEQIEFFYKYAPNRRLFDFLPSSVLREYSSEIANLIGISVFETLILLSDKMDELKDLIGGIAVVDEDRLAHFKQEFTRRLRQYVFEPLNIDYNEEWGNVAALKRERIDLENQIRDLQETIKQMRNDHDNELTGLNKRITELNNEIAALNREIEELKRQKSLLENELATSRSKFDELRSNFESQVRIETENRFAEDLRAWFPRAANVENESLRNVADVFEYARRTLKMQEERDRNFGNRKVLLIRLNELEKIRVELVDALENAINPIPELRTAISKVDDEIKRIRSTLGLNTEEGGISEVLMALINEATDLCELDMHLKFAEFLKEKGFIDERMVKNLWDKIYSRYVVNVQLQQTAGVTRDYNIRKKLRENASCEVILDAHNIILHNVLKHRLRDPVPEQSRRNLLEYVKALAHGRNNVKFIVVFDGSDPREENVAPNVKIVFSGGEGEHRADIKIVELVRMNPGADLFVVTDDEGLIREIRHYGGQPVRVLMFVCILQEFGILPQTFLGGV